MSFGERRRIVHAHCKGESRAIAPEDVRALPPSELAARIVKEQAAGGSSDGNGLSSEDESDSDASSDLPIYSGTAPERGDDTGVDPGVASSDAAGSADDRGDADAENVERANDHVNAGEAVASGNAAETQEGAQEQPTLRRSSRNRAHPDRLACMSDTLPRGQDKKRWIDILEKRFGQGVLMICKAMDAPRKILLSSMHKELKGNWSKGIKRIPHNELPLVSNAVSIRRLFAARSRLKLWQHLTGWSKRKRFNERIRILLALSCLLHWC